MQTIRSVFQAVLNLFADDGVYAAVTIAWIAVILIFGPRGVGSRMSIIMKLRSHSVDGRTLEGLLLALGLDLIFTVSVILRVRNTIRSQQSRK